MRGLVGALGVHWLIAKRQGARTMLFIVPMALFFAVAQKDLTHLVTFGMMIAYFVVLAVASSGRASPGVETMLISAGGSRRGVVCGLYASVAILVGIIMGGAVALTWVLSHATGWPPQMSEITQYLGLGLVFIGFLVSVTLPLYYKFGPERGRLYVLFPVASVGVVWLLPDSTRERFASAVLDTTSTTLLVAGIALCVLLMLLSCLVSQSIMRRTDL